MTAHIPDLLQALKVKSGGFKLVLRPPPPFITFSELIPCIIIKNSVHPLDDK